MIRIIATAAIAPLLLAAPTTPALADGQLNRDIQSVQPEAQEDCEALRESLESQRDDNILNPADMRELRDAGC